MKLSFFLFEPCFCGVGLLAKTLLEKTNAESGKQRTIVAQTTQAWHTVCGKHNTLAWGLFSKAHNTAKLAVIRPPIYLSL